jgi:3-isopropylmalate/(R)-2-methylmalate dehydratase small subunit
MKEFTVLHGIAAPLLMRDVNTDLIAPSLVPGKTPTEIPLVSPSDRLFANLRYDLNGQPKPDFVLNQPRYSKSTILLTGQNFGCGSSRETAVWCLMEYGFRCIIAPSFGEIFNENAFQNGLLPVPLSFDEIHAVTAALERTNSSEMVVDLENCTVQIPGMEPISFFISEDRRLPLLEGLDQLGVMLRSQEEMLAYETREREAHPWIYDFASLAP